MAFSFAKRDRIRESFSEERFQTDSVELSSASKSDTKPEHSKMIVKPKNLILSSIATMT